MKSNKKSIKIIYFIHVPWKWIKQRPHFIAELLSKEYEVVVAERKPLNKEFKSIGKQSINLVSYFQLPKDRLPIIHFINKLLQHCYLGRYIQKADIMWLTNPYQYSYYKKENLRCKVIYDCMDDLLEFEPTPARRAFLRKLEERLYREADIVFASSQYLKTKLAKRYGDRKVEIVNNAIKRITSIENDNLYIDLEGKFPIGKFIITYIGTIEKWLDLDLLTKIIEDFPQVVICLFGPLKIELPTHPQIIYYGTVPHDSVFSVMNNSDALIMPFILNELILSVNPVKLYEYIYSGKPCIAPRYVESENFEDFVYLYNSIDECKHIISKLLKGKGAKRTIEECRAFALANTWEDRVNKINATIRTEIDL